MMSSSARQKSSSAANDSPPHSRCSLRSRRGSGCAGLCLCARRAVLDRAPVASDKRNQPLDRCSNHSTRRARIQNQSRQARIGPYRRLRRFSHTLRRRPCSRRVFRGPGIIQARSRLPEKMGAQPTPIRRNCRLLRLLPHGPLSQHPPGIRRPEIHGLPPAPRSGSSAGLCPRLGREGAPHRQRRPKALGYGPRIGRLTGSCNRFRLRYVRYPSAGQGSGIRGSQEGSAGGFQV